jgi:hypothetical protein
MAAESPMLMGSKREKEDPFQRPRRSIGRPVAQGVCSIGLFSRYLSARMGRRDDLLKT